MGDVTFTAVLLLALAALAAGFVDAVVGGGGLIQLPALLLGLPGASPVQILATNKLASFCGTTVASATYYRRVRPDPRTFVPLMVLAFVGAMLGATVAFLIPQVAPSTRSCWSSLIVVGRLRAAQARARRRHDAALRTGTGTRPPRCSPAW